MHKEPSNRFGRNPLPASSKIFSLQIKFLFSRKLTMQPRFQANIDGKVGNKTGYIIERQRNNKERIEIDLSDLQLLAGRRQMV